MSIRVPLILTPLAVVWMCSQKQLLDSYALVRMLQEFEDFVSVPLKHKFGFSSTKVFAGSAKQLVSVGFGSSCAERRLAVASWTGPAERASASALRHRIFLEFRIQVPRTKCFAETM